MFCKKLLSNMCRNRWTVFRPDHVNAVVVEMNTSPDNSINGDFYRDFHECMDYVEENYYGTPMVIASQWENDIFSVGMDKDWLLQLPENGEEIARKMNSIFERLYLFESPTFAAVNGNAFGGGFILSLCCDFRFIDPYYEVCTTAPKMGLSYPSSVYQVVKYEIPFFKKFLLTGDKIDGYVAIRERISLKHKKNPVDDALDFIATEVSSPEAFVKNKISLKVTSYEHYQETEGKMIDTRFIESTKKEGTKRLIEEYLECDVL